MKKTLASLVLGASAMFGGCSSQPEVTQPQEIEYNLTNNEMRYGTKVGYTSSDDGRFKLPLVNLGGLFLNPKNPEKEVLGDELGIILRPYSVEKSLLSKDRTNKSFELESDKVYVIKRYGNNGEFEFNRSGRYHVKADLVDLTSGNEMVSTKTITHKDIRYKLEFVGLEIGNEKNVENFYVGFERGNDNSISRRVLIKEKGAKELVDTKTGQLTLRNPEGIFVLEEIDSASYLSRNEIPTTSPPENNDPNQTGAARIIEVLDKMEKTLDKIQEASKSKKDTEKRRVRV